MRKIITYLLFLVIPVVNSAYVPQYHPSPEDVDYLYKAINLSESGLDKDVFKMAIKGMKRLAVDHELQKPEILSVIDYSQSSKKKRLFVIDLKARTLLFNTYVAHGKNSGNEYATYFSNEPGSLKSSLGFFITENPVTGTHTGLSLLLTGVEKGFNDNAAKRAIIIHTADYVNENYIHMYGRLGRSFGCPVLPPELNKPIIETIKGGTCLFVYYPSNDYLSRSALLN